MNTKPKKTLNTQNSHSPKNLPKNRGGFISVDFETACEIDYLSKLTKEERQWYERFLENEMNAHYHKDGKDVIKPGSEDAKRTNRDKQRRIKDLYNSCYQQSLPSDQTLFIPKENKPRTTKLNKPLRKPVSPKNFKTTETIEEYLARGGNIKKIPKSKS